MRNFKGIITTNSPCCVIFSKKFRNPYEGGGVKFKIAPGRQLPSLRHCVTYQVLIFRMQAIMK